jgi:protein-tyrosine-phosphatase
VTPTGGFGLQNGLGPTCGVGISVVTLCTGNAARSVMAGVMLETARPDLEVVTTGTFVVDGQVMSWRTREALAGLGLAKPEHRSTQAHPHHLDAADLVLAMAAEHVGWIRRTHPEAAARTASIKRLVRDLPDGPPSLPDRLAALGLDEVEVEPWEDVRDPAGGEVEDYVAVAEELDQLVAQLAPRL